MVYVSDGIIYIEPIRDFLSRNISTLTNLVLFDSISHNFSASRLQSFIGQRLKAKTYTVMGSSLR